MQSRTINQLVMNGAAPLSYASPHIVRCLFDVYDRKDGLIEPIAQSSIFLTEFPQESLSIDDIRQIIATYSPFQNKNITALLRSALTFDAAAFRQALHDFKLTHRKIFAREINQHDRYQNTLIWYLTIGGLYESIEALVRVLPVGLDVSTKNGVFSQTILHYAVTHASLEHIHLMLDMDIDTNYCDRFGRTALHYVALYGTKDNNDVDVAKLLLDHGIMLNLQDYSDQTSLHFAIIKEKYVLIEYLISLPNINICMRNKEGYTPLGYLCEDILQLSEDSFENDQCTNKRIRLFKMMSIIIDRCPPDQLSANFHLVKQNEIRENLFLPIQAKFNAHTIPFDTDQDHCLFVEQLLTRSLWDSAISGLCNTHNVSVCNALIQCLSNDPHVLLTSQLLPASELSRFLAFTFYCLASNFRALQSVVPVCDYSDESCESYIKNYHLHINYTTFIHACLHDANLNVFSLKHLCRYSIRQHLKSHITDRIEKCSGLKTELRNYLQLNELQSIYFQSHDLSSVVHLIRRLYNIHSIIEHQQAQNSMRYEFEELVAVPEKDTEISSLTSAIDTSCNISITQNESENDHSIDENFQPTKIEPVREQTLDEIMAQSDIPFSGLSEDHQFESTYTSQASMKTSRKELETNLPSVLSISDNDISTEKLENELANVHMKAKDIEEMIDKFVTDA